MAEELTIESLQAQLTAAQQRISEINAESKGHRLNWQNAKTEAETARNEAAAAAKRIADAEAATAARIAEIEKAAGEKMTATEKAAATATEAARTRAINADLRIAAKDAGATDLSDVLALLPRDKLELTDDGDVKNAADVIAEFKKTKPHLFGAAATSTSSTNTPPPAKTPGAKAALDMTDEEFNAALKNKAWRK
jgi:chromosome segregation ATPase